MAHDVRIVDDSQPAAQDARPSRGRDKRLLIADSDGPNAGFATGRTFTHNRFNAEDQRVVFFFQKDEPAERASRKLDWSLIIDIGLTVDLQANEARASFLFDFANNKKSTNEVNPKGHLANLDIQVNAPNPKSAETQEPDKKSIKQSKKLQAIIVKSDAADSLVGQYTLENPTTGAKTDAASVVVIESNPQKRFSDLKTVLANFITAKVPTGGGYRLKIANQTATVTIGDFTVID